MRLFSLLSGLKANRSLVSLLSMLSIASLCGSTIVTALAIQYQGYLESCTTLQWAGLFAASMFTMAAALTPSTLIALIAGYFIGWTSVPYILITYPLAALLGYTLGKVIDQGHLLQSLQDHKKFSTVVQSLKAQDWLLMILVRLSPVLPFSLMNVVMSALRIPLPSFIIGGLIGMLPRTLFSLWLGLQGKALVELLTHPQQGSLSLILTLIATVLSIGGILYLGLHHTTKAITTN